MYISVYNDKIFFSSIVVDAVQENIPEGSQEDVLEEYEDEDLYRCDDRHLPAGSHPHHPVCHQSFTRQIQATCHDGQTVKPEHQENMFIHQ